MTVSSEMVRRFCAEDVDQIQGFTYKERSVIRDFRNDRCGVELWSQPHTNDPGRDSAEMQVRLQFERTRVALTAALSDQVVVASAVADIIAERQRQISKEGWTLEHDDEHEDGSLADAAACYAATTRAFKAEEFAGVGYKPYTSYSDLWPASWSDHWFRPKRDRRRRLVIAAALLVAEIERLDRASAASSTLSGDEPNG